ncbi:unnamed protein product [Effrenium voratum]|nr:unnamed protein product [Effrenium voratum]
MSGVEAIKYFVKDEKLGPENSRNVYLKLKNDLTAEHRDEVSTLFGGGYEGTTKLGSYTIDRDKGIVTVKFTKSEYRTNHSDKSDKDQDITEEKEYSLEALGIS